MQVRLAEHTIRDWRLGSSNLELRITPNESFVADDDAGGSLIEAGAVYARVACTVANETDTNGYTSPVLTIPEIFLYSTSDALVNRQATYRAAIYNSRTGKIVKQFQELNSFALAAIPDDNWGNVIYNNTVVILSTRPNFDTELKQYADSTYMFKTGGSFFGDVESDYIISGGIPQVAYASLPVAPSVIKRYKLTDKNRGFWYYNTGSSRWTAEDQMEFDVANFGAKADAVSCTVTLSGVNVTATTAVFDSSVVGKTFCVLRGLTGGVGLFITTIATYVDSTHITLTDTPGYNAASQAAYFGTDNSDAFNDAISAADTAGGGRVTGAPGNYLCVDSIIMKKRVTLTGASIDSFQIWSAVSSGGCISSAWTPNSSTSVYITLRDLTIKALDVFGFQAGFEDKGGSYVSAFNVHILNSHYGIVYCQTELSYIEECVIESYNLGYAGGTRNSKNPTTSGLGWTKTGSGAVGTDGSRWYISTTAQNTYYNKALGVDMLEKGFTVLFRTPEYVSGSGKQGIFIDDGTHRFECIWQSSGTNIKLNGGATRTASLSGINRLEVAPGGATAKLWVDGVAGVVTAALSSSSPTGITWGAIDGGTSFYYWTDLRYWSSNPIPAGVWLVSGPDYDATYSAAEFTNRITIRDNQLNGLFDQLVDDGGYVHTYDNNNFNGGIHQMWIQGPYNVTARNNEHEGMLSDTIWISQTTKQGSTTGNGGAQVSFLDNLVTSAWGAGFFPMKVDQVRNLNLAGNYFSGDTSGYSVYLDSAGAAGLIFDNGNRVSGGKLFNSTDAKYPFIYSLCPDPTADVREAFLYRLKTRKLKIYSDSDDATGSVVSSASIYLYDDDASNYVRVKVPGTLTGNRTITLSDLDGTTALQSGTLQAGKIPYANGSNVLITSAQLGYSTTLGLTSQTSAVSNVDVQAGSFVAENSFAGALSHVLIGASSEARINSGVTSFVTASGHVVAATNNAATSGGILYGLNILATNGAGTLDDVYGSFFEISNAGAINNIFGHYVGTISGGTHAQPAYSFYAADGNARNYFAGAVELPFLTAGKMPYIDANHSIKDSAATVDVNGRIVALSYNKVTITAPASAATITLADGKTFTVSNTLTFTGTDSSSVAFGAGGTVAYTGGKLSQFAATSSAELAGVISDETGSGLLVFNNAPDLTAPTVTTIAVGSGTVLNKILRGTVTIDPASINAGIVSSQTFTLTGAVSGDSLVLNVPAAGLTAGLIVLQSFVSSTDTITVVFQNTTGSPIDQASESWTYMLVR